MLHPKCWYSWRDFRFELTDWKSRMEKTTSRVRFPDGKTYTVTSRQLEYIQKTAVRISTPIAITKCLPIEFYFWPVDKEAMKTGYIVKPLISIEKEILSRINRDPRIEEYLEKIEGVYDLTTICSILTDRSVGFGAYYHETTGKTFAQYDPSCGCTLCGDFETFVRTFLTEHRSHQATTST